MPELNETSVSMLQLLCISCFQAFEKKLRPQMKSTGVARSHIIYPEPSKPDMLTAITVAESAMAAMAFTHRPRNAFYDFRHFFYEVFGGEVRRFNLNWEMTYIN